MRAVIQRVTTAQVSVDGAVVGQIGLGLLAFVGVHVQDDAVAADRLAKRVANLRIFDDEAGKMNLDLFEVGTSEILAISNFTVYGDASKSRRPTFTSSAEFEDARKHFSSFVEALRGYGATVAEGVFGADMKVELVNDGPVTLVIDS